MTIAGLFGSALAVPSLRARGPYLAMVTIAFGFMVEVTSNRWSFTGGPMGIISMPAPTLPGGNEMTPTPDLLAHRRRRATCASCWLQICSEPVWGIILWHCREVRSPLNRSRYQCLPLQSFSLRRSLGLRGYWRCFLRPPKRLHQQRYLRILSFSIVPHVRADGRKRHAARATGRQRHS